MSAGKWRLGQALVVAASLAGCASAGVHPSLTARPGSGKGIVLVSVAHQEAFLKRYLGSKASGTVPPKCRYRNLATGWHDDTIQVASAWSAANDKAIFYSATEKNALGRPAIRGRVSAIALPAGDYEFARCEYPPYQSGIFSLRFSVAEGEVRYLGRIEVEPYTHDMMFGIEVKDAQEEDFEKVRALWPEIDLGTVRKALLVR